MPVQGDTAQRWCILLTGGGRTLPLWRSLAAAGFEVWTPVRTFRRVLAPGRKNERKVEVDAPILPTIVFARAAHLSDLACLAVDPASTHPAFSIFRHAGRIPLVGEAEVCGLQEAEAVAVQTIQAQRDADTKAEADRIRIAALKTERARRKAQRSTVRVFKAGTKVDVADMPSMIGKTVTVIEGSGRDALVDFGGRHPMKIEAWRLSPHDVDGVSIAA